MLGPVVGDTRPRAWPTPCISLRRSTPCAGLCDILGAYGGLAQFGYPISEEFTLQGQVVQYFERARFDLGPRGEVRLTRIGADLYGH